MKILIFSPAKPYTGAESIVTCKLAKAFINKGWQVNIVCHDKTSDFFNEDLLNITQFCVCIQNKLLLHLADKFKNFPILNKIYIFDTILWVLKATLVAIRLNKKCKYNVVISRIMPQYGHIPALFFSMLTSIPWIANWSDPCPPIKAPHPYGSGSNAKIPFFQKLTYIAVLQKATWHTFPSPELRDYFLMYSKQIEAKNSIIPHVILNSGLATNSHKSNDKLVLLYTGSLTLRNPINLLLALKDIISEYQKNLPISIQFIGNSDNNIHESVKNLKLGDYISLIPAMTYKDTLKYISKSDVALIIEADTETGIFLPSKLMDYLQFNKPVFSISPKQGVMQRLLKSHGGGLAADVSSYKDIKKQLTKLIEDWHSNRLSEKTYNVENLKSLFDDSEIIKEINKIYLSIGNQVSA